MSSARDDNDARPTMSMMTCLKRLVAVNGRLVRHTRLVGGVSAPGRGWRVEHRGSVFYGNYILDSLSARNRPETY